MKTPPLSPVPPLSSSTRKKGWRYEYCPIARGGTFTDGVAEEAGTGRVWVGKCLTTPDDPGVSDVITQLLTKIGGEEPASRVIEVVHGTTLVINTLIG